MVILFRPALEEHQVMCGGCRDSEETAQMLERSGFHGLSILRCIQEH